MVGFVIYRSEDTIISRINREYEGGIDYEMSIVAWWDSLFGCALWVICLCIGCRKAESGLGCP